MVLYSLLNRGIWFSHKPFHNMNTAKFCLGLHLHLVISDQQIARNHFIWRLYVFPWQTQWKCLLPPFPYLFHILEQEYLVLKKSSPETFWFKDHMSTVPPPPFPTLVILLTTSWDFETVIGHLRYLNQCSFSLLPMVRFLIVSI